MPKKFIFLPLVVLLLYLSPLSTYAQALIKGDVDGNGIVDIFDYNILVENFGRSSIPATPTLADVPSPTITPTPRATATPTLPDPQILINKATHVCTPLTARLSWTSDVPFATYFVSRCTGINCSEFEPLNKVPTQIYDDSTVTSGSTYSYIISSEENGQGMVSKPAAITINCTTPTSSTP